MFTARFTGIASAAAVAGLALSGCSLLNADGETAASSPAATEASEPTGAGGGGDALVAVEDFGDGTAKHTSRDGNFSIFVFTDWPDVIEQYLAETGGAESNDYAAFLVTASDADGGFVNYLTVRGRATAGESAAELASGSGTALTQTWDQASAFDFQSLETESGYEVTEVRYTGRRGDESVWAQAIAVTDGSYVVFLEFTQNSPDDDQMDAALQMAATVEILS